MTRLDDLRAAMAAHKAKQLESMAVPPLDVLSRKITPADIKAYPVYFIVGPGREIAERTECDHGYLLVSTCPGCDADEEA